MTTTITITINNYNYNYYYYYYYLPRACRRWGCRGRSRTPCIDNDSKLKWIIISQYLQYKTFIISIYIFMINYDFYI